jgi:hypothetical protein
MANTRIQIKVEDWIRREWLAEELGQNLYRERLTLEPGGEFDFDAVSSDRTIAAVISTSSSLTASGKYAVGKMMKIRSDLYFLLLTQCSRRIAVFTERSMFERWLKEQENGRVPNSIEFMLAEIPDELRKELIDARRKASDEVSPGQR